MSAFRHSEKIYKIHMRTLFYFYTTFESTKLDACTLNAVNPNFVHRSCFVYFRMCRAQWVCLAPRCKVRVHQHSENENKNQSGSHS